MYWSAIQPENRFVSRPDFGRLRPRSQARRRTRDPRLARSSSARPNGSRRTRARCRSQTPWQRWAWSAFLRDAADRYGPDGSFWRENPDLPYLPIRDWEIWNEENIVTFTAPASPASYAELLRISGRVLHGADPGSKVIVGGLFGRPLQVPPNIPSGDFLSRLYRARDVKQLLRRRRAAPLCRRRRRDPRRRSSNLRRIMRVHHDAQTAST